MTRSWIDLERRFVPFRQGEGSGEHAQLAVQFGTAESWKDLLQRSCVVVLGEAGTGKTTELKEQAHHLCKGKCHAFFLPIEDLAAASQMESAFDLDEKDKLDRWKDSTDEAWFFLDSVDESKLKGQKLGQALRRFAHDLTPHLARVHLLVSSRVSDWRSSDEEELSKLQHRLACSEPSNDEGTKSRLHVVQLAPLGQTQVEKLARHQGIDDLPAFIDAVKRAHAFSFLERPLDVEWMLEYWRHYRRIDSLYDLIEHNISRKLEEKEERVTKLSPEKARQGAAELAAVATLTARFTFQLPDEERDEREELAIDPRAVLKGWTNDEIKDLLARGLFDEATYGRVRLHHRSVQEFLAAQVLLKLVGMGMTRADMEALLFKESAVRTVVPRQLAAVAAWMAGEDREIFRRLVRAAPEILLTGGDPSRLSPEAKGEVLQAYAERYRERKHVPHYFDSAGLSRFASPEIAASIREMLGSNKEPEHLKLTLLRMVEEGPIPEAADAALTLALAPGTSSALRRLAIRAVAKAGVDDQRQKLRALLTQPYISESPVALILIDDLFPSILSIEEAIKILRAMPEPKRNTIGGPEHQLSKKLPEQCSRKQRQILLRALIDDFVGDGGSLENPQVPRKCLWLIDLFVALLCLSIENDGDDAGLIRDACTILLARKLNSNLHHSQMMEWNFNHRHQLQTHMPLRRALFWQQAERERLRSHDGRFPRRYWMIPYGVAPGQAEIDIPWLEQEIVERTDPLEKLLAFDALLYIGTSSSQAADAIQRVSSKDAALRKHLERRNTKRVLPAKHPKERLLDLKEQKQTLEQQRTVQQDRAELRTGIDDIRTGQWVEALTHLRSLGRDIDASISYGHCNLTNISSRYDPELADATREGLKRFWRVHEPIALHEHTERIRTPVTCILGLTGLQFEVEDGLEVSQLDSGLMRRAIGYGAWELNGFPEWFDACAKRYPGLIRESFAPALKLDYDQSVDDNWSGRILWKILSSSQAIRAALAPELWRLVRSADPPRDKALSDALDVVVSVEAFDKAEAITLARERCASTAGTPSRFAIWWCFLADLAPVDAVKLLQQVIETAHNKARLVWEICARIEEGWRGRRRPVGLASSIEALSRFVPIVYAHVRDQDTTSQPNRGEHYCRSILGCLAALPGAETVASLRNLCNDPALVNERETILDHIEWRIREDATIPMHDAEAVRFIRERVLIPRTSEELFQVALQVLDDIRHDIEQEDFSVREAYRRSKNEESLQNFIAHELDIRRRDRYQVAREPEVTRKNRPDIRLYHQGCDRITIEIKVAESWSGNQLEAAIKDQLVGKYMHANGSGYGILVVCSAGSTKGWAFDGQNIAGFANLIKHLRTIAESVAASRPSIRGLRVVGIDFH